MSICFPLSLGALTISLLFALLYDLFDDTSPAIRLCAALSGSLILLVSESFWRFSEVAEVYTLQNFLILVLVALLIKARHLRSTSSVLSIKLYWIFAFLYGLSAGAHVTMALFAPAFLLAILLAEPCMFKGKALAFLAFFFLFGFAVYLYLPLRSLSNPVYDWGDPQTFSQFWNHLTDRKDAPLQSGVSWVKFPYQMRVYRESRELVLNLWCGARRSRLLPALPAGQMVEPIARSHLPGQRCVLRPFMDSSIRLYSVISYFFDVDCGWRCFLSRRLEPPVSAATTTNPHPTHGDQYLFCWRSHRHHRGSGRTPFHDCLPNRKLHGRGIRQTASAAVAN